MNAMPALSIKIKLLFIFGIMGVLLAVIGGIIGIRERLAVFIGPLRIGPLVDRGIVRLAVAIQVVNHLAGNRCQDASGFELLKLQSGKLSLRETLTATAREWMGHVLTALYVMIGDSVTVANDEHKQTRYAAFDNNRRVLQKLPLWYFV